jgi:hypothetical protein
MTSGIGKHELSGDTELNNVQGSAKLSDSDDESCAMGTYFK